MTLTFLSLFLLMERVTITDWLFGFAPPEVERRWRPVLEKSISAVSSSLIGNVAISIVAATVAGVSAWALGLPFSIALAVIAGFLDLIPQVGATIAAVILVAVALTVSTPAAIAMLVIQLVYQQGARRGGRDPGRALRGGDQDHAQRGGRAPEKADGHPSRPRPAAPAAPPSAG